MQHAKSNSIFLCSGLKDPPPQENNVAHAHKYIASILPQRLNRKMWETILKETEKMLEAFAPPILKHTLAPPKKNQAACKIFPQKIG